MNENKIEGAFKAGAGKLKSVAGDALDDPEMALSGDALQAEGKVQEAAGVVQEAVTRVAGNVWSVVDGAKGKAKDTYERASDRAEDLVGQVDPFVREQPYAALAIAALGGFVVGLIMAASRPSVVYVKPRV